MDVKSQDYYYEAVSIAKPLGIVAGVDGKLLDPKAAITRQNMMVMAARTWKAAKAEEFVGDPAALEGFKDAASIFGYAAGSIAGMIEQDLIQGNGHMIYPLHHTTRAEAGMFLYRLLNWVEVDGA